MNKKILIIIGLSILMGLGVVGILLGAGVLGERWQLVSPKGEKIEEKKEKPLVKYEFERVRKREPVASEIKLDRVLEEGDGFTSYLFFFESEGHKISGRANIPAGNGPFPVIIMLRGGAFPESYKTGDSTQPSGRIYSSNGFITLAPDFLGYGESDPDLKNEWEGRLIKNMNIPDLIASVKSLPQADPEKIGLWGWSNGGLSAITTLVLSGKAYPTTLWGAVSQYFPYDVLHYTYTFEDRGKYLRKSLSEFEKEYDTEKYSFDNYLSWINPLAPIQIHQGGKDDLVLWFWSENLRDKLLKQGNEVNYYFYPEANHSMSGSWDLVVERDLQFFKEHLTKSNL